MKKIISKALKVILCIMLLVAFWVVYRVQVHPLKIKQKTGVGMVKVEVYQGAFSDSSTKPILSLDAESEVAKEIVREIKGCRHQAVMTKIATKYVIGISYFDGSRDSIVVGKSIFSLRSHLESPQTTYYWRGNDLFSLIERHSDQSRNLVIPTEKSSRGAEGGGGSEEGNR